MKKADFFQKKEQEKILCQLCPRQCLIVPDGRGRCQGRVNRGGVLYTENYAMLSSLALDPIEKKPLYHFYPGSRILSAGTFGCNFHCRFCQNWQISQQKPPLTRLSPAELVELARKRDSIGIAYTYSEPVVWYEYLRETGAMARQKGLKNVLVTNAYLNRTPLQELVGLIDAVNVDLKAFNEDFYRRICGGSLQPVLDNIELLAGSEEIHLEVTTLLISGLNDREEELRPLFAWLAGLSRAIPLHLSRYFPGYRLERPATPLAKMKKAYRLAKEYLDYVYLGNINHAEGRKTYCPACGEELISRGGFRPENHLVENRCPACSYVISGRFKKL